MLFNTVLFGNELGSQQTGLVHSNHTIALLERNLFLVHSWISTSSSRDENMADRRWLRLRFRNNFDDGHLLRLLFYLGWHKQLLLEEVIVHDLHLDSDRLAVFPVVFFSSKVHSALSITGNNLIVSDCLVLTILFEALSSQATYVSGNLL